MEAKDAQLQQKDAQLQQKDAQLQQKDAQLQQKDDQLQHKDDQIQRQATELRERTLRQQRELQTLRVREWIFHIGRESDFTLALVVRRTEEDCRQRWRLRMLKMTGSRERY